MSRVRFPPARIVMINLAPSSNRIHIAFFGRRNAGKSSLVNAVTGQNLSIVSGSKGTTTDPVYKAMELLPLGPVVIIDTPGIDDDGDLGELRIQKAMQVLRKTDAAVLVLDGDCQDADLNAEKKLIELFNKKNIPYLAVINKADIHSSLPASASSFLNKSPLFSVSAKTGFNINELKEKIADLIKNEEAELFLARDRSLAADRSLTADLIKPDDLVVLVVPIDESAPKGRLILPVQQVIRDILDAGAIAVTVKESGLSEALSSLNKKPALVITDSQVFEYVSAIVPQEIPLTSFSILFARRKGFLETSVAGAKALDTLQNGNKILICEGCTHHRQCGDIGTVKLPNMIRSYTKANIDFSFCSGGDFPENILPYKVIIHCGGCMLNDREMHYRCLCAEEADIPFTNYGVTIAHIKGILERCVMSHGSCFLPYMIQSNTGG